MKTPNDLFGRLPSVTDLLENPRIKGLVDRVQEMEVTTGVRQFVDRMRREVSRRTIDAPIPSITELADRAARFILGRHTSTQKQAINATGQLWPAGLVGPPLPEDALAAMSVVSQHYHVGGATTAAHLASELAGGQAARLYASPAGAMLAALHACGGSKRVVVARGEMGTMDSCIRLTELAKQAGVELVEVGAADSVSLDDYRTALDAGAAMLLRIESLPHVLREQTCRPEIKELAKLADQHGATFVHNIGRGPLAPLPEPIEASVPNAAASLSAGTAVVVARGDGYLGGPRCGIVVGRRPALESLDTPLAALLAVDPLIESALAATLALWKTPERTALAIPTLALLSTPLLNLESRAERIAAQIETLPGVISATLVEIEPATDLGANRLLPSFGISVQCETDHSERIARQLREGEPRILANWSEARVLLDLRTVAPADDIALVTAFELEHHDEPSEGTAEPAPAETTNEESA
ncbi:hypothetical protein [Aeoliella mucimassa]|uniref:L-seryl-tRNA(Sec) selenium transferase n=1 Tax=Aeoliella mucimassa TaxID=2527972 RepID=A0A518AM42_9BACT|nr:hypothetical protein [Aeoliella mucimassa]QDU55795.1 L-seryl-tRNA(Sec) selenium transferase [Aeoliella mucimassa]